MLGVFIVCFLLFYYGCGFGKRTVFLMLGSLDNHMLNEQERGRGTAEFNFL